VPGESKWIHATRRKGDYDNSEILGSAALVIAILIPILPSTAAISLYRVIHPQKARNPRP